MQKSNQQPKDLDFHGDHFGAYQDHTIDVYEPVELKNRAIGFIWPKQEPKSRIIIPR